MVCGCYGVSLERCVVCRLEEGGFDMVGSFGSVRFGWTE